jgi:DNA-binding phage protein
MGLTAEFETGIIEQIRHDHAFMTALLREVDEALSEGENGAAQGMLRALVAGTTGFHALAKSLTLSTESLLQTLSPNTAPDATTLRDNAQTLRLAARASVS